MKINIRIVHPTQGKTIAVSAGAPPLVYQTVEIEGKAYVVHNVLHELNGNKLEAWVDVWPL